MLSMSVGSVAPIPTSSPAAESVPGSKTFHWGPINVKLVHPGEDKEWPLADFNNAQLTLVRAPKPTGGYEYYMTAAFDAYVNGYGWKTTKGFNLWFKVLNASFGELYTWPLHINLDCAMNNFHMSFRQDGLDPDIYDLGVAANIGWPGGDPLKKC